MQRYLREHDPEAVIRVFYNSRDFELFYFQDLLNPAESNANSAPSEQWNAISALSEEEIAFLRAATFAQENPFAATQMYLTLNPTDFTILAFEHGGASVFGGDDKILRTPNFKFTQMIPAELPKMKTRLEAAPTFTQGQVMLLCLKRDTDVWTFKARVDMKGGQLQVLLEPFSNQTLKALGRDSDADDVQSGKALPIDMVLFRYDCLKERDVRLWVTKIATLLKKANLWPPENRPKFICIRNDTDQRNKADFSHPFIDDLLCLPLDRLIFLQKIEIAMNLPEQIKPNYLFVQASTDNVELAKLTKIERISDVGFSITNPVELKKGTPAHVYFRFHGQPELMSVFGKVIRNLPHPTSEKDYLSFFTFFALERQTFSTIRNHLTKDTAYKLLVNSNPKDFEYNPDNIFIPEDQKTKKTFALIDTDEGLLNQMADNIEKELGNCEVFRETSYFLFLKNYLTPPAPNAQTIANAAVTDLYVEMVSYLIGYEDMNLQMTLIPPNDGQTLLGHDANGLFAKPQGWMDLFENHDARELLTEAFLTLSTNRRSRRAFPLKAADGVLKYVNVEFVLESNNKTVRVNMTAPDSFESKKKLPTLDELHAIVVDQALLPKDLDTFIPILHSSIAKKGVKTPPGGPAIIVTGDRLAQDRLMGFLDRPFYTALPKPIETRRLLFTLSEVTDSPFSVYAFDNIGWKEDQIEAKLARPAKMVEVGEFGATIKVGSKLKVGSMFYLFGSIFKNAPDQNLCCRVYHTKEVEGEKDQYFAHVVFFGITDSFLKFTRAYIRETYASQKAKEGKS
jgi:hypothetical protein